jgi:GNAT superfamily N-acetyltransferase
MDVRELRAGDEGAVSALVMRSFAAFLANDYAPEGVEEFTRYAGPEAILHRAGEDHLTFVALLEGEIVGMIEFRRSQHLSMLFVDESSHGRGVARRLFEAGLERVLLENPGLITLTVNSSRHGVPAYESLGFRVTGPERIVNGIRFIPMALDIAQSGGARILTDNAG